MIKRMLVALDPGEDTPVATWYAADIAQRYDAAVSGLAVIDTKRIAAEVGPGGAVGAMYYADLSRKRMMEEARNTARRLLKDFETRLTEQEVRHGERMEEGVPVRQVVEDTKYHDLLLIGHTSHFFYTHPDESTNALPKIVKKSVSPTLVVGDTCREVRQVLIAYDGSDASARAMQRFAQLQPFGTGVSVELVHMRKSDSSHDEATSQLLLRLSSAFLRAHGFGRVVETSRFAEKPADGLLEHVEHVAADLVVAGAHSVSAMRRMAFGSTTDALLRDCPVPFFLYH